ncbi:MAG TPA: peptide deformylase [Firmicutes bacterium]|nr:peptide deformylase [Bacillota bacterium]
MIRKIVTLPDPVLRRKAVPVRKITKRVRKLIDDMAETMYEAEGAGLAAPQIGVSERIIVIDVGQGLIPLINPKIVSAEGEERDVEGCLSIPGKNAYVTRSKKVTVTGLGLDGKEKRYEAEGLLARAFQHEIDHLDGILYIDYLTE